MKARFRNYQSVLGYMLKCLAAAGIVYSFVRFFHYTDVIWCLISAVLVLSPNANEAVPLAESRIEANIVGSVCILLCLLARGLPPLLIVGMAYVLAIAVCFLLDLMPVSRSALVAVTIIGFAPTADQHLWNKPLERVLSVTSGCLVGLLITVVFHRGVPGQKKHRWDLDHSE
ncbi:FUSC family protein [Geomesophilobacter sediminis]|uniref:FUSC family protein n=1 Tax=Geomesophilobacter sediminis TaxID=2798584 RepID=A0A8J7J449_9BACT|nr:FUSC family protein [Geomesophilobacter sediminis]MBJ6725518.1 FUSC family protein [Geomesophilobacter sediminis]